MSHVQIVFGKQTTGKKGRVYRALLDATKDTPISAGSLDRAEGGWDPGRYMRCAFKEQPFYRRRVCRREIATRTGRYSVYWTEAADGKA